MDIKNIALLGSTGSIGCSTLDVVTQHPGRFCIRALAAFSNAEKLAEQARLFRPDKVCLVNPDGRDKLKELLDDLPVTIVTGEDELVELTRLANVDLVVNAVVGAAGLKASIATITHGRDLALANKESLVAGGPLFKPLLKKTGAKLLPIDSEHSAIWQVLQCGKKNEIRRILLTASGGPFRDYPAEKFPDITVEQALNHPTWKMGAKITIDSATLANKGLEVIEAVQLFDVPANQVSVVVHPQSIVHSMVEYADSSVIAQLSSPDMRLPITYALFWPERRESEYGRMDWTKTGPLTFEEPNLDKFPMLRLAFEVADRGGVLPAVYNAANEIAVAAFLKGDIRFTDIADIVDEVVKMTPQVNNPTLDDILQSDQESRRQASLVMEKRI